MLFSWMPVPGTTTPEPEPVETVSAAALPSRVDDGDVRRPARRRRLGDRAGTARAIACERSLLPRLEAPLEAAPVERALEAVGARAALLAHDVRQRGDRVGAAGRGSAPSRSSRRSA